MPSLKLSALLGSAAVLAAVLAMPTAASAQDAGVAATQASDSEEDRFVITARKREESVIDVPGSVSAFNENQIDDFELTELDDFLQLTPGAVLAESTAGVTTDISLRGVGTPGDLLEPGVGVYVDDIYVGGLRTVMPSFYDLERVEVMRGPQGALYGRNASGGAINFITARPDTETFIVEGRASYRTFEETRLSGTVNIPIDERVAVRGNLWWSDRNDGSLTNGVTGDAVDTRESFGGRVSALFEPTDNTSILITAESTTQEAPTGQLFYFDGAPTIVGNTDSPDVIFRDTNGFFDTEFTRITGQIDHGFDFGTLTVLAGYRTYDLDALEDQDFSARLLGDVDAGSGTGGLFTPFSLARQETIESTYAEVRLASPDEDRFTWLVGANVFQDDGEFYIQNIAGAPLLGTPYAFLGLPDPPFPALTPSVQSDFAFDRVADLETTAYAIFAELGYDFTDRLEGTVGLRYSHDEKDGNLALIVGPVISAVTGSTSVTQSPSQTFENFSPSATLTYHLTDQARVYGRVATGFRAGGINVLISDPTVFTFEEETSINYEIGLKSVIFDGTTNVNLAAFIFDQDDVLLGVTPTPLQFANLNAGEARTIGFEAEVVSQPTDGLTLGGSFAYYDSEYTSINAGVVTATEGSQIAYTPDWTASVMATYIHPLTNNFDLVANGSASLRRGGYYDGTETNALDDREIVNLSLGIESDHFTFSVFGDNVLDDEYEMVRTGPALATTVSPADLTAGVVDNEGAVFGVRLVVRN